MSTGHMSTGLMSTGDMGPVGRVGETGPAKPHISLFHHYIAPLFFMTVLPLILIGNVKCITAQSLTVESLIAATVYLYFFVIFQAILYEIIPSNLFEVGPTLEKQSGIHAMIVTVLAHLYLPLCVFVVYNITAIVTVLNLHAFALCFFLWYRHRTRESHLPAVFNFYAGVRKFPLIGSFNLKWFVITRVGMMLWTTITWCCLTWFVIKNEICGFTHCFLMFIYLVKFYYGEEIYTHSLDIAYDNFGYYMCWGILVMVPGFYTSTSLYFIYEGSTYLSDFSCAIILLIGVATIYINYTIDYTKMEYRKAGNPGFCKHGAWKYARHMNYTTELIATFCWTLPSGFDSIRPWLYFIYLFTLLMHRVYRDEKKCAAKYGQVWKEYKRDVPYRFIPYLI